MIRLAGREQENTRSNSCLQTALEQCHTPIYWKSDKFWAYNLMAMEDIPAG
jgi:hypothetical protein